MFWISYFETFITVLLSICIIVFPALIIHALYKIYKQIEQKNREDGFEHLLNLKTKMNSILSQIPEGDRLESWEPDNSGIIFNFWQLIFDSWYIYKYSFNDKGDLWVNFLSYTSVPALKNDMFRAGLEEMFERPEFFSGHEDTFRGELNNICKTYYINELPPLRKFNSLKTYHIDPLKISVSGVSSGGYMAVQLHVSHSSLFTGVGVFSAGPYACASGRLNDAIRKCMKTNGGTPDIESCVEETMIMFAEEKIDNPENLKNNNVFLYSSSNDTVINQKVTDALCDYYQDFVRPENILYETLENAEHSLPSLNYGNPCDYKGLPFINNCDFDGAGNALRHIYGSLNPRKNASGRIVPFDQTEFYNLKSLADTGYLYIPEGCMKGELCGLHVALHGCNQSAEIIGDEFYSNAGYNEWAETNNIIILYPQTQKKTRGNPEGCWDWWGYESSDYYNANGPQIKAIKAMVTRVAGIKSE